MSQRIVLTGVTRGLGRVMYEGFSSHGCTVLGCATNVEAIESLRDSESSTNQDHSFSVVDVSDFSQVEVWAKSILKDGPPDLLINNAALMNRNEELWNVHPHEFAALMNVNVSGSFHVIKAFVPAMIKAGSGVIVNFSSGWGRSTSPEVVPYCTSKWAIEGMSRGLSQELPRGLASVAFNPGVIHTDMLDSCFGDMASSYPSPEQWASRAVPFLLSLDASDNGRSVDVPVT